MSRIAKFAAFAMAIGALASAPYAATPSFSSSPPDDAKDVSPGAASIVLSLGYVTTDTGYFSIVNDTDKTVERIDVANAGDKLYLFGGDVMVMLGTPLVGGKAYHIEISPTAFKYVGTGQYFAGIADATTFNFEVANPPHREILRVNGTEIPAGARVPALPAQDVDIELAPTGAEVGAIGEIYIGADFGGRQTYFLNASMNWLLWDGASPFTPYFGGPLPAGTSVNLGTLDLTSVAGATLFVGYGLGAGAAANADTVANTKFSFWPIR